MLGGSEKVKFKVVPGNHGFPVLSIEEVVWHISDFWEDEKCKIYPARIQNMVAVYYLYYIRQIAYRNRKHSRFRKV